MGYQSIFEQYADYAKAVNIYIKEYISYLENCKKAAHNITYCSNLENISQLSFFELTSTAKRQCREILDEINRRSKESELFMPFDYICNALAIPQDDRLGIIAGFLPCIFPNMSDLFRPLNRYETTAWLTIADFGRIFLYGKAERLYSAEKTYLPMLFEIHNGILKPLERIRSLLVDMELIYNPVYGKSFSAIEKIDEIYGRQQELEQITALAALKNPTVIQIIGEQGSGKTFLARHAARLCRRNLISVDMSLLSSTKIEELIIECKRECILQKSYLCITNMTEAQAEQADRLAADLLETSHLVFVCTDEGINLNKSEPFRLHLKELDFQSRLKLWSGFSMPTAEDVNLQTFADIYRFPPAKICKITAECDLRCKLSNTKVITNEQIESVCLESSEKILKDKAVRIITPFKLSDLILPEEEKQQIREGMAHIRYQHRVYDNWGFSQKITYGRGLSMLFEGSPGTGKTMAASIFGNELGLPVLKVDLSKLMSKYIGETEKNLGEIFDAAQKATPYSFLMKQMQFFLSVQKLRTVMISMPM